MVDVSLRQPTPHPGVLTSSSSSCYQRPGRVQLVVDWKREKQGWLALVVFVDETANGATPVQRWFPLERLRPCTPDPNPPRDDWF